MNTVVSQFGSKPRCRIQPLEWYRGANLTNMSAVYEVWIKKTHKQTWSPMLYASVLAMFWTIPGVLQAQSPVKIHVLGPSKLLLGLTETGHSLLKTRYRELVAAIGAVFKDLRTGQFLDRDIISKATVPSTWKKELVGTVGGGGVPLHTREYARSAPYRKEGFFTFTGASWIYGSVTSSETKPTRPARCRNFVTWAASYTCGWHTDVTNE